MRNILQAVGLGLVLLGLSACASLPAGLIDMPKVTLTHLEPGQMGLLAQEFKLQLLVQNPNPMPLPITGMSYTVSLNGHEFATGVSNQTLIIPALGEQRLNVSVTSSMMSLAQQLMSLGNSDSKTFSYKLDGKLHVTDKFTPLAFSTQDQIKLD